MLRMGETSQAVTAQIGRLRLSHIPTRSRCFCYLFQRNIEETVVNRDKNALAL